MPTIISGVANRQYVPVSVIALSSPQLKFNGGMACDCDGDCGQGDCDCGSDTGGSEE